MTRRISTVTFAQRAAAQLGEGGYKLAEALRTPQIADVFATLDGHRPLKGMLIAPFQVVKSAAGQLHCVRNMVVRPGPALWYNPSDDASKEFAGLKFNPLADAQPMIQALTLKDRTKTTTLKRGLAGGSSLLILSSGTEADRHAKTARDIYIDELHQIEIPGAIGQIRNRRGAYPKDYLEFMMSTGLIADTEAAVEWSTTDQRTWHMRCPECQKLFVDRFAHYSDDGQGIVGGLRYEKHYLDNGLPNERLIRESLVYECPHCLTRLPDTDATRLALSGTIEQPRGMYVAMNPDAESNSVGWTFSGVSVRPWLPIVMRFERANLVRRRGDLSELGLFIREELAGIWDPKFFQKRVTTRPIAPYKMGEEWSHELKANPSGSRFATIDLQQDYYVLTIRMWGSGSASRLRFCDRPKSVTEIKSHLKTHGVEDRHVFMDSRHDTARARRLAAIHGWNTMQGDGRSDGTAPKTYLHADGLRRIYDEEPKILDAHIGTLQEGQGANCFEWLFSKQSALDRLNLLRNETFCPDPMQPDKIEPLHACPIDTPEWYWKQATAHTRKDLTNKDGSVTQIWFGGHEDHAEDCEAMNVVCATMAGLTGAETLAETEEMPA